MIKLADIYEALGGLIKEKAGLGERYGLKVHVNHVLQADHNYAWIKLRSLRRDEGYGLIGRAVGVDIMVVLKPDRYGEVKHSDLYEITDLLDMAINRYIEVKERAITVYESESRIFDDILTYSFKLDFADYIESLSTKDERREFMQELHLALGKKTYASPRGSYKS